MDRASKTDRSRATRPGTTILSIFKQGNTITHDLRSARSDGHDSAAARILPRFRRRKIRERPKEERTRPVTKEETHGIHGDVSYSISLSHRVSTEFRTFPTFDKQFSKRAPTLPITVRFRDDSLSFSFPPSLSTCKCERKREHRGAKFDSKFLFGTTNDPRREIGDGETTAEGNARRISIEEVQERKY